MIYRLITLAVPFRSPVLPIWTCVDHIQKARRRSSDTPESRNMKTLELLKELEEAHSTNVANKEKTSLIINASALSN